jgi:metal-dependent amidase/aminoacylase/carboxypeptidase family protein
MRACGHDEHIAIIFGTAKLLQKRINKSKVNIRFIFQNS